MRFPAIIIACAFLAAACGGRDEVDDPTFVSCYARILVIRTSDTDSVSSAGRVARVLDGHRVTKDAMQRQMTRYADDPARYRRVLARIADTVAALDSLVAHGARVDP